MSLKAKIEAVIYASEEPVTLAQLVGLLGEEAQAELDRAAAAQQTLALDEAADGDSEPTPIAGSEAAGEPAGEPTSEGQDAGQPAVEAAEAAAAQQGETEAASETPDSAEAV